MSSSTSLKIQYPLQTKPPIENILKLLTVFQLLNDHTMWSFISFLVVTLLFTILPVHGIPASPWIEEQSNIVKRGNASTSLKPAQNVDVYQVTCDKTTDSGYYTTWESQCTRAISNSAWFCSATNGDNAADEETVRSACIEGFLCEDNIHNPAFNGERAYCVRENSMVSQLVAATRVPKYRELMFQAPQTMGSLNAFRMMIVKEDDHSVPVMANSIKIEDQMAQVDPATKDPYTTVATNSCPNCVSLGIDNVPSGTARWRITLSLPALTYNIRVFAAASQLSL